MDATRRKQVEELFALARELPVAERCAFLESRAGGDREIVAEVESLLEHYTAEFLEEPEHLRDLRAARDPTEHPTAIAGFEIVEVLGQGGMGVVYLAQQQQPIRRRVALKLIKLGMDTRQVVARFETERQALALMNHPNIARVYDAGATDQGRPYFVMEYVDGVPIAEHCDRQQLTARQRLELFVAVCEGVQHAHQKGIIHRDIKSSNVLVAADDAGAVPKIIDFGIAKATEQGLTEAQSTELGVFVGTPEYMSPEQVDLAGRDIDTRTDVYSLGVLLYELLVGVHPFDGGERSPSSFDELRRKIREQEPPRPSTRLGGLPPDRSALVARNRQTELAAFSQELRGDLDWIVLKALEKERTRRYASASELAADIGRYTGNEPVVARPPSSAYRTRKFVRRHRFGVAAALLITLALVVGMIGTGVGLVRAVRAEKQAKQAGELAAREAERANEEARAAEEVVAFLVDLFAVSDPGEARGNTITARELLDQGAGKIRQELGDQPRVQGRLMGVMGDVYRNLGLYKDALPLLEQSLGVRREVYGDRHAEVAKALNNLANLLVETEQDERARPLYEEAIVVAEQVHGPDDPQIATMLKNLADLLARTDELDAARALHQRALKIREAQFGPDSREVAYSIKGLADVLKRAGDYEAALPLLERSLEIRQRTHPPDHPRVGFGLYYLAEIYVKLDDPGAARPLLERALAIWQNALGPDHAYVRMCAFDLAEVLRRQGEYAEARPLYELALRIDEQTYGPEHEYVAESLEGYAALLRETGDDVAAERLEARIRSIRARSSTETGGS